MAAKEIWQALNCLFFRTILVLSAAVAFYLKCKSTHTLPIFSIKNILFLLSRDLPVLPKWRVRTIAIINYNTLVAKLAWWKLEPFNSLPPGHPFSLAKRSGQRLQECITFCYQRCWVQYQWQQPIVINSCFCLGLHCFLLLKPKTWTMVTVVVEWSRSINEFLVPFKCSPILDTLLVFCSIFLTRKTVHNN